MSLAVLADRTTPQVHFDGKLNEAMGLGWEVMRGPPDDPIILLHTGSDEGIKTMILLLPTSQRGLVMFTNRRPRRGRHRPNPALITEHEGAGPIVTGAPCLAAVRLGSYLQLDERAPPSGRTLENDRDDGH